jgi:hypothetical protein
LYFFDPKTRQLRPLEPEEMQQLVIPNDDSRQRDNVSSDQQSNIDEAEETQSMYESEHQQGQDESQIAVVEQDNVQQSEQETCNEN